MCGKAEWVVERRKGSQIDAAGKDKKRSLTLIGRGRIKWYNAKKKEIGAVTGRVRGISEMKQGGTGNNGERKNCRKIKKSQASAEP